MRAGRVELAVAGPWWDGRTETADREQIQSLHSSSVAITEDQGVGDN